MEDLPLCMDCRSCQKSHSVGGKTNTMLSVMLGAAFSVHGFFLVCILAILWEFCHSGVTSCGRAGA